MLNALIQLTFISFQVSFQPSSHAVIARPDYSSNGGEASVGAALSVSDTGSSTNEAYHQDILALLGQPPLRAAEEPQQQLYSQPQQPQQYQQVQASTVQSVAPQYQQVSMIPKRRFNQLKVRPNRCDYGMDLALDCWF